jgi:hypothetical protein
MQILHDEIKQAAHAIISEYVRAYPSDPHTDVLARLSNRIDGAVLKLMKGDDVSSGPDPNASPVPHTAVSNEAPAGGYLDTPNGNQRSISPNTMSREPSIAGTSASMCPRVKKSIAPKCGNDGARILHLYGWLVPSETR